MPSRGIRNPTVWGRATQEPQAVAAGFTITQPLGFNLSPQALTEARFERTVGTLWVQGSSTDFFYYGIILADEDTFPTAGLDPSVDTDVDWVVRHLGIAVPGGQFTGEGTRIDLRSGRKMRERDREPYFTLINASGAGNITVMWSLNTLFKTT